MYAGLFLCLPLHAPRRAAPNPAAFGLGEKAEHEREGRGRRQSMRGKAGEEGGAWKGILGDEGRRMEGGEGKKKRGLR